MSECAKNASSRVVGQIEVLADRPVPRPGGGQRKKSAGDGQILLEVEPVLLDTNPRTPSATSRVRPMASAISSAFDALFRYGKARPVCSSGLVVHSPVAAAA